MAPAGAEKLSLSVIWAYAMPRIAFAVMGAVMGVYFLKYATDVLLIAPAAIGIIMAAARIWAGVSDPLAGYWSDGQRDASSPGFDPANRGFRDALDSHFGSAALRRRRVR